MKVPWEITDHVCAVCFGRILVRAREKGERKPPEEGVTRLRTFRCADCGTSVAGSSAAVICSCGIMFKGKVKMYVKCATNPDRRPEFPAEIIAAQKE